MTGPTSRGDRPGSSASPHDDRVERLARRVEQQHHLIARLSAMLEQRSGGGAKPEVVRVPPFAGAEPSRRPPLPDRPRIAWGLAQTPPPLDPAPGFDCQSLLGRGGRAVGVVLIGLDPAERLRALAEIAARQRTRMDFRPVFLTDGPDLGPFLERGYTVEYLGAAESPTRTADRWRSRIETIRDRWGIATFIGRRGSGRGLRRLSIEDILALGRGGSPIPVAELAPPRPIPRPPAPPPPPPATPVARPASPPAQFQSRSYRPVRRPNPAGGPLISYCIPVMDRGADLRATLGANLREHRDFGGLVEFIVVFFDKDSRTQDWVRRRYRTDIASGRLRLSLSDALDSWHFGKAKNAFRSLVRGKIYSSLDADNFVLAAETQQLIDVHAVHGEHFVFHHFSGTWGDGTSGRVSLPASLYREVGYNEGLLPRQFDEIDLILSVLKKDPLAALICLSIERNLITLSDRTRTFVNREGLRNPFVRTQPVPRRLPLHPKSPDYVQGDDVLRAMNDFNQAISFLANISATQNRDRYVAQAYGARHRLVDLMTGDTLVRTLFEAPDDYLALPRPAPGEVSLFACVKDDWTFLPRFIDHYRRRGVTRFFIVDDHSDPPLRGRLEEAGVHVAMPKVGTFLTAKGFWIEALMKAFLAPGQWALTVDADEFVDPPAEAPDFPALAALAAAGGRDWVPGLLVDMLPPSAIGLMELERDPSAFDTTLSHCCHATHDPGPDYLAHPAIRWGFGRFAHLSWALDARFHAFGTIDSLRKVPFLRYRPGLHLNQGFHDLHFTDGTPPLGPGIWDTDPILPIRHYKLHKLLSAAAREQLVGRVRATGAMQYHTRTAANIRLILGEDAQQAERLLRLPTRPYPEGFEEALRLRHESPRAEGSGTHG